MVEPARGGTTRKVPAAESLSWGAPLPVRSLYGAIAGVGQKWPGGRGIGRRAESRITGWADRKRAARRGQRPLCDHGAGRIEENDSAGDGPDIGDPSRTGAFRRNRGPERRSR